MEEFYDEAPARRYSGEADYGGYWRNGPTRPRWRVSYVHETGEVYAVQLGGGSCGPVEVLGIVPPDPPERERLYYATLERLLSGWADEGGRDIAWVRTRIASASVEGEGT